MKLLVTFICFFIFEAYSFSQNVFQDEAIKNNVGFFNITQFRYVKNFSIRSENLVPGIGIVERNLNADKSRAFGLQTINGFFISPTFSLGVGIGLDGYRFPVDNTSPIFIDVRHYIKNKIKRVYLFGDVGFLASWNEQFRKGYLLRFGIGYKYHFTRNTAFIFDINYEQKNASRTSESFGSSSNRISYKGISFNIGIML